MSKMIKSGSTGEILSHIKRGKNIAKIIENRTSVERTPLHELLHDLLAKSHINKADIIAMADIDRVYGYEVFRGKRIPSRDVLLKILIALDIDFNQMQGVLKEVGYTALYPKNVRDAVIIHGIVNKKGLMYINHTLYGMNERVL